MVYALRLWIETEHFTSTDNAIASAILAITDRFQQPNGITAKDALVFMLEATCMLPGIFNLQMLSWREKLQSIIHDPEHLLGSRSLQYKLPLSSEVVNGIPTTRSVAVQTVLQNPESGQLLEFVPKTFELEWVLKS